MRTKDGKSRQFAFIGFRTEREAQEAINYFNKNFFDTCRISCEIARKIGDPDAPRPWSRYSKEKVKELAENGSKGVDARGSGIKDGKNEKKNHKEENEYNDPQLQEFLHVMQPRTKSKFWTNDTVIASEPLTEKKEKSNTKETLAKKGGAEESVAEGLNDGDDQITEKSNNIAVDEVSDMDYFKSRVKTKWSDSESGSSEDDDNDTDNEDDDNKEETDKDSNDDFPEDILESKEFPKVTQAGEITMYELEEEDKEEAPSENSDGEVQDPENPSSAAENQKDEAFETSRLFVRNLPYAATEDELEEYFSKFGNVSQVHLVVDKDTKRSKGLAYIHYTLPESAARALEELDKTIFQGRLLHVMAAKQKQQAEKPENNFPSSQGAKTLKQRREEERKASEAGGDTRAWNSLFMRPDTVVENIARRHGVSKSDFLDHEADDLAVRIALGETQVIAETKRALADAGVNVTSLEELAAGKTDGIKRSNHVLLVKNLPYGTSEGELAKMFGKFGSLDKIILPPTKTLALVIFLEPSEARVAFKGLAYKRYKDAPLYLEWAPASIMNSKSISNGDRKETAAVGEYDAKKKILEQMVEGISEEDVDPDRVESRSLFVKNLNFKTSDENLQKHVSEKLKGGKILSVRIKKHMKSGKNVSMGFGFMEFDSVETATNVCRDMQGTVLDGHALILQLCHAKKDDQAMKKVDKDRSSTKLLVRNVAFEATEKDLRQLFSPFGQIKSLRLPMKFGNHRGFAFVEYVTKQEAQNALQALSNTHLYGRHLVLERAKEGETLEELRARTAAQLDAQSGLKLSKKRKDDSIFEGKMKFQRITD